ncbi:MAG: cyclase family protein, partial [Candidatus Obscuribacterales bacterium]|nr:cyclase family protein [Candidatus Obscuribacterales bacterium]
HIEGDLDSGLGCVGSMSLDPFIGPVKVIDISPCQSEISKEQYLSALDKDSAAGKRILFKTCHYIRYEVFEDEYAYLSVELVESLSEKGVVLVGLDTPSVDHVRSKSLDAHHALMANGLVWLENLDLTEVVPGDYTLIALPLKLLELEASPVRAVLLKGEL